MSESRSAFSIPIYAAFQALIVLGYALRPSWYRPLLFIPITIIAYHIILYTDVGVAGVGLGAGTVTQTLFALDGIVLRDIQKTLHRVGEKPGQILSRPFLERLSWGWHLHNSPRGVRWAHELSHIPKNTPALNAQGHKGAFIVSRVLTALSCAALQAVLMVVNSANPAMAPGTPRLINQSIYVRMLSLGGLAIPAYAQINILHCLATIILVAADISKPVDWPPLFGSLTDMYSVQTFWRSVWHQMLRRPALQAANFILHTVLCLPRPSQKFQSNALFFNFCGLLKLHTAFLISGLVHLAGEYMMQGYLGFGALKFFCLQPWAITFEILVRYLITGSGRVDGDGRTRELAMIWRVVGYIWVVSWFFAVGHLFQQPMVDAGLFAGPKDLALTRRIGRWLALDVI